MYVVKLTCATTPEPTKETLRMTSTAKAAPTKQTKAVTQEAQERLPLVVHARSRCEELLGKATRKFARPESRTEQICLQRGDQLKTAP
jgi:hypothetical protein